jgi:hypothetical protein
MVKILQDIVIVNESVVQVSYNEHTDINNTNLFAKKVTLSSKNIIIDNIKY